jgi:chaperonin GroES
MAAKKKTPKKVAKKAKAVKAKAKTAKKTVTAKSKKAPAKKVSKPAKKAKALKVKAKTAKAKSVKAKVIKKTPVKTVAKAVAKPTTKALNVKPVVNIDYSKAITPLLDRLVVKVLSGERVTAGGLIIPETASMATGYLKAKVLAIGTGIKTKKGHLKPLDVQVGDTVLFASYAGTKVVFNSEELEIIHESDVMGVVQD